VAERPTKLVDLLVVGAGPAGAMAAATAARGGLGVWLVDKRQLPRHKPCGGGMPLPVQEELRDLVPEAVVDTRVRWMRHSWRFQQAAEASVDPPGTAPEQARALWMVQRPRFDHALVQAAAAAGARVLEGHAFQALERGGDGVTVTLRCPGASGEPRCLQVRARHVIGADGAAAGVAACVGLRPDPRVALAIELEVPHQWDPADPLLRPDLLHLDYGVLRRGYAWLFPKADHLNIGAGLFHGRERDVRRDPRARQRIRAAIDATAAALGIEPGSEVYERARLVTDAGQPTHSLTSYYRPEDVADTPIVDPTPGPVPGGGGFGALTRKGLEPDRITETIHSRMPTPDEIDTLALPAGEPVMILERCTYTADGRCVEFARGVHAASRFAWTYSFTIPD